VPRDDPEARRLVELLRALIRRHFDPEGKTYVLPPPMHCAGLSIAEILIRARDRAKQTAMKNPLT
jgi:hypothetical protein